MDNYSQTWEKSENSSEARFNLETAAKLPTAATLETSVDQYEIM